MNAVKKIVNVSIFSLLSLLMGCAQNYWIKNGASSQEFEIDKAQCNAQAFSIPNATLIQIAIVQNQCLRGRGWNLETRYKTPFSSD